MVNTINEALNKIYSYVDYSRTHVKDVGKKAFSLDNMICLLEKLGNPQKRYPVIHVAGTKGKGSVCAMLASALENAGFRTGLYTSPHLICFNERIRVNGKMISEGEIVDLTNRVDQKVSEMDHVSNFEFTTAMAFEYFREQNVDIAVVETGLGGRLDSTNVVDPILTVITSVSYDHTDFLGNTIKEIAAEKAGIIKPKVPVICAWQPYHDAGEVIRKTAELRGSPWISVPDRYCFINERGEGLRENMLIWRVEDRKLMENWCSGRPVSDWAPVKITLPLAGSHQMQNAAAVFAAINKLKFRYNHLDVRKALEGMEKAFWPCRFEKIADRPALVVDGAHNNESVKKLCESIEHYFGACRVKCIFGASEDKSLDSMIRLLAPHVDEFILTRSIHPRAADPKLLAGFAAETGRKNRITNSLEEAFALYEADKSENTCYIAAGSLFVAGGIRELMMARDPSLRYFEFNQPVEK